MPDWSIAHVSANVSAFLGSIEPKALLGQSLDRVLPVETVHSVRNQLQTAMLSGTAERLDCLALDESEHRYDLTVHMTDGLAVIEAAPSVYGSGAHGVTLLRGLAGRLRRAPTVSRLLSLAAQQMRAVTGYDRVMIYRFLHDDSGEVVAEAVRPGTDAYLGLRYPATDIPAQARALYRRQPLRLIPDVDYVPVPVLPGRSPDGMPLDLGLAALRSVSPVHIQYLRNMNVRATLTVSLMRGDTLWGLIACHHSEPHYLSGALCSAAELFGQMLSLQIDVREQQREQHRLVEAQNAHDKLLEVMSPRDTVFEDLSRYADMLNTMVACDGMAVWSNGQLSGEGVLPPDETIIELISFLGQKPADRIYATSSLAADFAPAARFADRASGVLAIPISRAAQDYLLFFRREVIQTVTWGGNPDKAVQRDATGHLHPRRSFEAWRETVRCQAQPWTTSELRIAETLRVALLEVVLRRSELIASERQRAQDSQSLLIAELNHRVKNVLSLVLATTRQSAQQATSVEAFTQEVERRIQALASAHDQINAPSGTSTHLRALLESEALAWHDGNALDARIQLTGSAVLLDVRGYQTLALVFHEMMTNAAKYGALSVPDGQLAVSWKLIEDRGLQIEWNESGGPEVQPPTRRGFGSIVTERTIPFELQGEARVEFRPEGLFACFLVPREHASAGDEQTPPRGAFKTQSASSIAGLRLLLVEDSMMIALDAQTMLEDAGVQVEIAGSLDDARRALRLDRFDLVVLDVNLSGETSLGIAAELEGQGYPFLFATGYGARTAIPERFDQIPVVTKPYNLSALAYAIGQLPGIDLPG